MELAGKLLIAMPAMGDTRFDRSVIFICAHSDDGAMGLIVNKPKDDMKFDGLLEQLNIPAGEVGRDIIIHAGGPVERGRGFVLHSPDFQGRKESMEIPGGLRMTGTLDILRALARGRGPARALLALGYSGWGPGQLEKEIRRNDWLVADAPEDLIFDADNSAKWTGALQSMGISPLTLSATAGRA